MNSMLRTVFLLLGTAVAGLWPGASENCGRGASENGRWVTPQHPANVSYSPELHFTDSVLDGLKLIGFAVWERRSGSGRNVTFPARQYVVNGDRRSFALLRPVADAAAQERVRELVLQAYAEYEETATEAAS